MAPIVAKLKRLDKIVVNGIKAQTSRHISFEYAGSCLKIRTSSSTNPQSVARYLDGRGTEFYTFNRNPGQR